MVYCVICDLLTADPALRSEAQRPNVSPNCSLTDTNFLFNSWPTKAYGADNIHSHRVSQNLQIFI